MTDWHAEDIKAAIRKEGATLRQVANDGDVTPQALTLSLRGRFSERCDQVIADFLKVPPQTIWPSRYHPNGERIRFRAKSAAEKRAA